MVTPRELLESKFPEAVEPMDLLKNHFGARVKWVKAGEVQFGNNPFPEPGFTWTPYTPPKGKK